MAGSRKPRAVKPRRKRRACGCLPGCALLVLVGLWIGTGLWHSVKRLPHGLAFRGDPVSVDESAVRVLTDTTFMGADGRPRIEQTIFDHMLSAIAGARRLVVVDDFYFTPLRQPPAGPFRSLAGELTAALVAAKGRAPNMPVVVITDPINTLYGGARPAHFQRLRAAGVDLVVTDLTRLRDSNPIYSGLWRLGPRWLGNSPGGFLPNPLATGPARIGVRSWLALLNFKANHRKVLICDDGKGDWMTMVGSLNAEDGSLLNSNFALEVTSTPLALQAFRAESAVMSLSHAPPPRVPFGLVEPAPSPGGDCRAGVLTESAIRDRVIAALADAGRGDTVDVAVFYLSHRGILRALIGAADRGAVIRLILDPSRGAFGRPRNGIPNRQAAQSLLETVPERISVRWYDTHGEQFHPKMIVIRHADTATIIAGSANFTRRNLDDLNLEADVALTCPVGSTPDLDTRQWFDRLWSNDGGSFTVEFTRYEDPSPWRRLQAVVQERTGLGTF